MDVAEIFLILGMQQTSEEKEIKQAYRAKLSVTNPEDNPEGFKRLRKAYEGAIALSRQKQETEESDEDVTPSGLWIKKVEKIYQNIKDRQDTEKWRELFREDIFLSLDGEEECRIRLLAFLMSHFRLPTDIWKLLNHKLSIVRDAKQLKERLPGEFIQYIVNKCERGDDIDYTLFEGEEEASYDLFLQYYDKCWQALQDKDYAAAEQILEEAEGLCIAHPVMEISRLNLYMKTGREEAAFSGTDALLLRYPEDLMVKYHAAELYWQSDQKDKAVKIYIALREENDEHYMANLRLTSWYYDREEYQRAKGCAEKVLQFGGDENFLLLLRRVNEKLEKDLEEQAGLSGDYKVKLELCWCYLQDGKYCKGLCLAESISQQIETEKKAEYLGLLSKLYIEEAMYEEAAATAVKWEEALLQKIERKKKEEDYSEKDLERDKDRIRQSHLIRVQAYRQKGFELPEFFQKTILAIEQLEQHNHKDIGLLLEKAQIYIELQEYDKCIELVQVLVNDYQVYAAHATALEAYRRQWNAAGVIQESRNCINHFSQYARAYESAAKVYLDLDKHDELDKLVVEARENDIKSILLNAYVYLSRLKRQKKTFPSETDILQFKLKSFIKEYLEPLKKGNMTLYLIGLPIITEYMKCAPCARLFVERGIFHQTAGKWKEAEEDYLQALALAPVYPSALYGLSRIYKYQGDYEKALVFLNKAIRYGNGELSLELYADLGDLYTLLEAHEKAYDAYKQFVENCGFRNKRMDQMVYCCLRLGRIEEAFKLTGKCYEADKDRLYIQKVKIYQWLADQDNALQLLQEWESKAVGKWHQFYKKPELPSYHFYHAKAWQHLIFDTPENAVVYFNKMLAVNDKRINKDEISIYADMCFACALMNDQENGKKYAMQLKYARSKASYQPEDYYFRQEYLKIYHDFILAFFLEGIQNCAAVLAKLDEDKTCQLAVADNCKKIAAAKWLLYRSQGKETEAAEILKSREGMEHLDEYAMAIRRNL